MAIRKANLRVEAFTAISSSLTLIFAAIYGVQLGYAGAMAHGDGDSFTHPSKIPIMAMYGIPPLVTLLLAINNIIFYAQNLLGPLYTLLFASVSCAGWFVTTIFWAHCHDEGHHTEVWNGSQSSLDHKRDAQLTQPAVCYQHHIMKDPKSGYMNGVSEDLGLAVVILATVNFAA